MFAETFFNLDINECADNPCNQNANCINNEGSYLCECNTGYTGNGTNCTGMNTTKNQ